MSNTKPVQHRARGSHASPATSGLPFWSALSIVIAALITGLLLSLNSHQIAWPYVICFVCASLIVTLFVEPRALFLTVASLPILFGLVTPVSTWMVNQMDTAAGTDKFSTTALLTSIYPLAMYFPALAAATVGAALIAILRLMRLRREHKVTVSRLEQSRRRAAEQDRRNRQTVASVRQMSERGRRQAPDSESRKITVEELMARKRAREQGITARRAAQGDERIREERPREGRPRVQRVYVERDERRQARPRPEAQRRVYKPSRPEKRQRPSLTDDLYG